MIETPDRSWTKLFKVVVFSGIVVFAAFAVTVILVFHNPEWQPHLVKFIHRVWRLFIAYNAGSTSPGFVSSLLLSLLVLVIMVLYIAYIDGLKAMRTHIYESAAMGALALITIVLLVYGTQFAWQVVHVGYEDHKTLADKVGILESERSRMVDPSGRDSTIADLREKLRESQSQLESRKQTLHNSDPAFHNMTNTIRAFMTWRRNVGYDAPCWILVTTPDGNNDMYMSFITMAVFGANCPNGNLNNVGVKPENIETETDKGMIPGVIVFHALPDAKGANQLQTELENLFQVKRVYTIPGNAPANTVWLQFGTGVKWNTER